MRKLLILVLITALFISACSSNNSVDSSDNNCRLVSEPYDVVEDYTEQEEYTEEECESREFLYRIEDVESEQDGGYVRLEYDVINLDTETMTFRGGADWIVGESAVFGKLDPKICCEYTIEPDQRITVTKVYEDAPNGLKGEPNVIIPEKQTCETITKYRTIAKNRTVTKYRNKTVCDE
jgi:hypothetical protein